MKRFDEFVQSLYSAINSNIDTQPNDVPLVNISSNSKVSFEFYDDTILLETKSVFRKQDFSRLTEMMLNMQNETVEAYSKEQLSDIQSISKFGPWIKPNKRLGIVKSCFSSFQEFFLLMKKLARIVDENRLTEAYVMLRKGRGMYMPFSNEVGILFINSLKTDEDVLCHELIHFFQDVTGKGFVLAEENAKFNPIEKLALLNELETFGTIDKMKAKLVISRHEIIPYFNSICYLLEKNNVASDVPLKVINGLIRLTNELKKRDGMIKELKDAIVDHMCFAGMSAPEFAVLVICLVYGQHLTLLKRTIGNYFKDRK